MIFTSLHKSLSNLSFYFTIVIGMTFSACTPKPPVEHSTEASLADLKVYEGLEVTLFASEPMFSNPTNLAVDDRGRQPQCHDR